MTFIWTKNTTNDGQVRFNGTITGVDDDLQKTLRQQILSQKPVVEDEEIEVETNARVGKRRL
jgi:hypothetical protein